VFPVKQFASFDPEKYRQRLKLLRLVFNENQTQFAERVGINYKQWHHYERGYPIPREVAFILREQIPGMSAEYLWFGDTGNLSGDLRDRLDKIARKEARKTRSLQDQLDALPHSMRRKIKRRNKSK
jgi:hypothetical protein